MGVNFYDYLDFQKNQGGYRIMKPAVLRAVAGEDPNLV